MHGSRQVVLNATGRDNLGFDSFDLLPELPQDPRKFSKHKSENPTCVYDVSNGGRVSVGGFAAAENRYGLENAGVGVVVSVLGLRQKLPGSLIGFRYFRFDADRLHD